MKKHQVSNIWNVLQTPFSLSLFNPISRHLWQMKNLCVTKNSRSTVTYVTLETYKLLFRFLLLFLLYFVLIDGSLLVLDGNLFPFIYFRFLNFLNGNPTTIDQRLNMATQKKVDQTIWEQIINIKSHDKEWTAFAHQDKSK